MQVLSIPPARDVMSCLPMEQELAMKQMLTGLMHMLVHSMQLDAMFSPRFSRSNTSDRCRMSSSNARVPGLNDMMERQLLDGEPSPTLSFSQSLSGCPTPKCPATCAYWSLGCPSMCKLDPGTGAKMENGNAGFQASRRALPRQARHQRRSAQQRRLSRQYRYVGSSTAVAVVHEIEPHSAL